VISTAESYGFEAIDLLPLWQKEQEGRRKESDGSEHETREKDKSEGLPSDYSSDFILPLIKLLRFIRRDRNPT